MKQQEQTNCPAVLLKLVGMSMLVLLGACSGNHNRTSLPDEATISWQNTPALNAVLPPLPLGKVTAEPTSTTVEGNAILAKSDNAAIADTDLELHSTANGTSWGMWELVSGGHELVSVEILLEVPEGDYAWTAISNYSTGQWNFDGPLEVGKSYQLDNAVNLSPAENCYVAVICTSGSQSTIDRLILHDDRTGWQIVTVDGGEDIDAGHGSSLAVVDGNPAISYTEKTEGSVKYARSSSVTGGRESDWDDVVIIDNGPDPGEARKTSVTVISGKPAIAYQVNGIGPSYWGMRYARSTTSTGSEAADWSQNIRLSNNYDLTPKLAEIGGQPAIVSDLIGAQTDVFFWRSNTSSGANPADWYGPVSVYTGIVDPSRPRPTLVEVEGNPAISFFEPWEGNLMYVRSTTPTGGMSGDWSNVITVDTGDDVGYSHSLAIVDGNPAISYFDAGTTALKYARSETSTGENANDWFAKVELVNALGNVGKWSSLAVIGGQPSISYFDEGNGRLLFSQAANETGEGAAAWLQIPTTIDGSPDEPVIGNSQRTSLVEVDGRPAISYYDSTNKSLKYAILFY